MTDPRFAGIDYGSMAIKACVARDPTNAPAVLPLTDDSPFVPAAVAVAQESGELIVGLQGFRYRRRDGIRTAWAVRDQLHAPQDAVNPGATVVSALQYHEALLEQTGAVLRNHEPPIQSIAVAVPDDWTHSTWAVPLAAHRAGWRPAFYVRESISVLAELAELPHHTAVLVSLGFSAARLTCCVHRAGGWQLSGCHVDRSLSGMALRRALADSLAEEVVRSCRRDPREDHECDQRLWDAIDQVLATLQNQEEAEFRLNVATTEYRRTLHRHDIHSLTMQWQERLRQGLERVTQDLSDQPPTLLIVWGDLSGLLPVGDWLPGWDVRLAPLDVVARGTSRLCAARSSRRDSESQHQDLVVDCETGACMPHDAARASATCIPLVETLSASLMAAWPRLRMISPPETEEIVTITQSEFRLGRHPDCEWAFDQDVFPQVSARHAVIRHDGEHFHVEDLDSTNGTFVNNEQIHTHRLADGDLIRLGLDVPCFRFERPELKQPV